MGSRARVAGMTVLLLGGCMAGSDRHGSHDPPAQATAFQEVGRADAAWLGRATFGIDTTAAADYRRLGRTRFLDRQLHPQETKLPPRLEAQIAALEISRYDAATTLAAVDARYKLIHAMPEGQDKTAAQKALDEQGNQFADEAIRRGLLRAVYSPAQLQEQMVWFWENHFSVHRQKGRVRWMVGDYEEQAIRPHALGKFRDLVLATLEHPAMLEYLDNDKNTAGHVNENYARELLELHTLGVDGGYTQQDVQNLARVLTGAGVAADPPKLKADLQALYFRQGGFQFNPARHDFGPVTLLGRPLEGRGFESITRAVGRIVAQPACAQFISRRIAMYFVADEPPPALVARMAGVFRHTDGDIAAVLRTLFLAREFDAAPGAKFKDPMHFVVSAVRLAYDGRPISNARPMVNWLRRLGELPYGRPTPDGYPLTESGWSSSGQLSQRFEIARAIGAGNAGLFDVRDGAEGAATGFPELSNRLYFEAIEPFLSAGTRQALGRASSQSEWNTFLLSSPEFSYE